ncbi:MAG: hypothetical protein A4S09_04715 [Proteobacteria bacterium SG_bin7]|nr:MAG: hypothetical protein A4S09_04715 [Proteobacteria bacterium SG_bin7]
MSLRMTRRNFLKTSTLAIPGLMLFEKSIFSSPLLSQDPHFFVMVRAFGGMDATLGLDPQIMPVDTTSEDIFLEYRPEDIIKVDGLKFGPTCKAIVPFAKKCNVVNGVMMKRDAGHEQLLQYMASGKGDGSAPLVPVELAATAASGPYGVISDSSVYSASRNVPMSSVSDIMNEVNGPSLATILRPLDPDPTQISPLAIALRSIISSGSITASLITALAEVKKNHADATPKVQATIASFLAGASQQAILELTDDNFDTHSNHEKIHFGYQTKLWNQVADLFSRFEKTQYLSGSLMDYTTFMVITEFSRTPNLNGAKGKDHNTDTNSVLFAGKNILGGKTVGSSKIISAKNSRAGVPLHIAAAIDPKTGQPANDPKGATFILPENVIRTVADIFGNPKGFSSVDPDTSIIPGVKA